MANIVLVEDEFLISEVLKEFLELQDHIVFTASTGKDMLRILDEQQGKVDLVILDLTLPDMNGLDLLPKLTSDHPSMKLVICSGALPDELEFNNEPYIRAVLNKPFDLRHFRNVVDKILDDR